MLLKCALRFLHIIRVIIHKKKVLDSDWLRAVKFLGNTMQSGFSDLGIFQKKPELVQINFKLNFKPLQAFPILTNQKFPIQIKFLCEVSTIKILAN